MGFDLCNRATATIMGVLSHVAWAHILLLYFLCF